MNERKFRCIKEIDFLNTENTSQKVNINKILTIKEIEELEEEIYISGFEISMFRHFQEITEAEEILKWIGIKDFEAIPDYEDHTFSFCAWIGGDNRGGKQICFENKKQYDYLQRLLGEYE